jgi:hypothetical protein
VGLCFVNWSVDRNAYVPVLLLDARQTIYDRIFRPGPINLVRSGGADEFGRPSSIFTVGGRMIGVYASAPAVSFTAATGAGAIWAAIAPFNTPAATYTSFTNGYPNLAGPLNRTTLGADIAALTGNGILVEIFVNAATNNLDRVTVIRTDIARVSNNNQTRREVTITDLNIDVPHGDVRFENFFRHW